MSRNKSKIVKWEYVTKMFPVIIDPADVKRVHAPIEPSLTLFPNAPKRYLYLRPCVQGVDEDGAVVKYLYCTRDGRFFVRDKEGWNEILPNCHSKNYKKKGSGYNDAPQLRHFGGKLAHCCVAFAWLDIPKDVKLQMIGVDAPTKWEVDHLNGDHKNWTADNLQWVTVDENRRRGAIAKLMRRIALDPKLLTRTLLLGTFTMPDHLVILCLNTFKRYCKKDPSPLSADAIRMNFAKALDDTREEAKNWKSVPAYKLMTLGRVSHIKNKIYKRFYIIRKNHA